MPDQMRRDQFRPSLLELLRPDLDPVMTETEIRRHVIREVYGERLDALYKR